MLPPSEESLFNTRLFVFKTLYDFPEDLSEEIIKASKIIWKKESYEPDPVDILKWTYKNKEKIENIKKPVPA